MTIHRDERSKLCYHAGTSPRNENWDCTGEKIALVTLFSTHGYRYRVIQMISQSAITVPPPHSSYLCMPDSLCVYMYLDGIERGKSAEGEGEGDADAICHFCTIA